MDVAEQTSVPVLVVRIMTHTNRREKKKKQRKYFQD